MSDPAIESSAGAIEHPGFRLSIPPLRFAFGDVIGIKGPNGSGKSSLLKGFSLVEPGLLRARKPAVSGREDSASTGLDVVYRKRDGEHALALPSASTTDIDRMRATLTGHALQTPTLMLDHTLRWNCAFPLLGPGVSWADAASQADKHMRGLFDDVIRKPYEPDATPRIYSGGERQLIALKCVLARRPELLFADEPTAHLSPEFAEKVFRTLATYAHADGACVVVVSHDPSVDPYCDRRWTIVGGPCEYYLSAA